MKTILLTIVAMLLTQGTVYAQRQMQTVDGPESTQVAQDLTGYVVTTNPVGGLIAFKFPGGTESIVRQTGRGIGTTSRVSGPDRSGRIAFVNNWMPNEHLLKTIMIDGSQETEIFTRPGDAIWDKVIGGHLALAPIGGRVAFVSGLKPQQVYDPKEYLLNGTLEIWSIDRKVQIVTVPDASDTGLSWFSDGQRIAFVRMTPRDEVKEQFGGPDDFGAGFGKWGLVPAVCIYDLDGGETTVLHLGRRPVVAEDDRTVLLRRESSVGSGSLARRSAQTWSRVVSS